VRILDACVGTRVDSDTRPGLVLSGPFHSTTGTARIGDAGALPEQPDSEHQLSHPQEGSELGKARSQEDREEQSDSAACPNDQQDTDHPGKPHEPLPAHTGHRFFILPGAGQA